MRVTKFPWIKHTEGPRHFEIYSVSVSPDGLRLATGGLDGKVKIWSVETLYKYRNFKGDAGGLDNSECRPLCSMSRHEGAITCVRFCPTGRFLASGSDDKLILIWEKDEEKTKLMAMNRSGMVNSGHSDPSLFANSSDDLNDSDLEHWTVRKRLVAHDNDVQDMAWAPDGSILVTVGLDRSIVVWHGTTFEKIKKFDIHQSHVKGVVFDPAGKYFATCSDDRTMRFFRYRKGVNVDGNDLEFVVEHVIRDPFAKSPLTTYFRRCSWSPDGLYIAAPNGTNEGVNANVVIKRGSWESELSLIGHRLPCEVCSFSPRLYDLQLKNGLATTNSTNNNNSKKSSTFSKNISSSTETVIITAGQDKTLAIWSSSCATPLCVVTEISAKSITDVAWNPNGLNVYLCGLNGMVISLFFDESELGKVVPLEENNRALIRYGKDRDVFFPESIEQLRLEEYAEKRGVIGSTNNDKLLTNLDRINSLMNGTSSVIELPSEHKTAVMNVLIPRSKKHPNKVMPIPKLESQKANSEPVSASKASALSLKHQKVTITKSGKKRVAPTLISVASSSTTTSTATEFASTSVKSSTSKILNSQKKSKLNKIMALPHPQLPKHGLSTLVTSIRSKITNDESEVGGLGNSIDFIAERNQSEPDSAASLSAKASSSKSSSSTRKNNLYAHGFGGMNKRGMSNNSNDISLFNKRRKLVYPNWIKPSIVNPATIYGDKLTNSNVIYEQNSSNNQVIEVRYEMNNNFRYSNYDSNDSSVKNWTDFDYISRISSKALTDTDTTCKANVGNWELFLNEKVVAISSSTLDDVPYWCFCTEGGKLLIISGTGRQLCGSIELGCEALKLICNQAHTLCICSNGLVYSWKFKLGNNGNFLGKSILGGVSIAPIINLHASSIGETKKKIEISAVIEYIYMMKNGCPIAVIKSDTKQCIYVYDVGLECWIEVMDSWYVEHIIITDDMIKTITGNDILLKLMTQRLIRESKEKIKNQTSPMDKSKLDIVTRSWKSINECVQKCINRNLEKC